MQFKVVRWDRSASPTPSELQAQLFKEGLFPYDWSNSPGDVYAPHAHEYDKVIVVVHGSITWILPDANRTIETRAAWYTRRRLGLRV